VSVHIHDFIDCAGQSSVFFESGAGLLPVANCDRLEKAAKESVAFFMGSVERLMDPMRPPPDLIRLPYPKVWLEMQGPVELVPGGMIAFLCSEGPPLNSDYPEIYVCSLTSSKKNIGRSWLMCGMFSFTAGTENGEPCAIITPLHASDDAASIDMDYEAATVYAPIIGKFLTALNCRNVETVEHKPSRLKQSRRKKSKTPLFSYWTLHIKPGGGKHGQPVGTHASPRVHLRRGHIRQYKPGEFTWVQPCVVRGSTPGMVHKDYRLGGTE